MGQTLSEPVTEKASREGGDDRLIYGLAAMQGWRITMEDAHAAVLDMTQAEEDEGKIKQTPGNEDRLSFFGIYDGHGGEKVAHFAGQHLHKIVAKQDAFKSGDIEQGLKDGFLATDRAILSDPKYEEEVSGATASVGVISKSKIYVANAGDSRSVLGVKGRAKPLSYDHKPSNDPERARITAAGGFVDFGRVNGNLALSRAIGDFEFKKSADLPPEKQIVTAFPDVITHDISDNDEFLVIACDGIWDCQSSQAVVEFVRRGIAAKQDLSRICENMEDNCLSAHCETGGVGCDNMTMTIIGFLKGKTKEEWYDEIATRVANGDGPCAPPEYAEFRGPGIQHNRRMSVSSEDDFDGDWTRSIRDSNGQGGRLILLGNGTEVLTDSDDAEIFDHDDEDLDLDAQVDRLEGVSASDRLEEVDDDDEVEKSRLERAKSSTPSPAKSGTPEPTPNTAIPEKLVSPSSTTTQKSDNEVTATESSGSTSAPSTEQQDVD